MSPIYTLVYFLFVLVTPYAFIKCPYIIKYISVLIPISIIYSGEYKKYNDLFQILKGLSVFLPLILYVWNDYFKIPVIIFSYILAFNILEPTLLVELPSPNIENKINGVLLLILAILTPVMTLKNGIIGFNNSLWTIGYTLLLLFSYIYNKYFQSLDWQYSGIITLVIPLIMSIYNSQLWVPYRAYTLFITLGFSALLPVFNEYIKYDTHKIFKSIQNNTKIKYIWLCVNSMIMVLLINNRK